MRKTWSIRLFLLTAILYIILPQHCHAQVLPDTTNNHTRANLAEMYNDTANAPHGPAAARADSTADTIAAPRGANPKKAGMYSAILPGLGQLYNKQYWKIPVIYTAFGVATYLIINNLNNYNAYRKAYIGRINNPYPTDQYVNIYTEDQLQQLQSDYNKYLDLSVLFTGIGFALQVVDAIVSAHLKDFDISRDISMKVRPVVLPVGAGIGLVMSFR